MFVVTVSFEIAPENAGEFREAVLRQAENSLDLEADCHVFDVCVGAIDPASFFLYEKYSNADAFNLHLKSKHFLSFDTTVTPWVKSKTVGTWIENGDEQ